MIKLLSLFALLIGAARSAELSGYLVDKKCLELCESAAPGEACAPDSINVFYEPEKHTGWCLLLGVCVDSGYVLMSDSSSSNMDGRHEIILDLTANESTRKTVLEYIQAGTPSGRSPVAFPKVVVSYDDAEIQEVSIGEASGIPLPGSLEIASSWMGSIEVASSSMGSIEVAGSWMGSIEDEKTHQVICPDSGSPDMELNNLCFRSDISVRESGENYVIESNGCPDHKNMHGSSGIVSVVDDQGGCWAERCGTDCQGGCCGGSTGGCCSSSCSACGSTGCCGGSTGGCCSASCSASEITGCCGGSTGGCGSASCSASCSASESTGCCGGSPGGRRAECSATVYQGGCCGGSTGGCCSASCSASESTGCCGGSTGGCCSASCSACGTTGCCGGGCSGYCGGSCGGCCVGSCGGCWSTCGGCSSGKEEQGVGKFTPLYQQYTMIIPSNPGAPGDAKYFEGGDDVVGILSNGVLLDSHSPTWSYDDCNGHSDTKHQYHYHLPPQCFLREMGVATPGDVQWWIDSNEAASVTLRAGHSGLHGKTVRAYDDMAAQWPSTGIPSPVIGFARDGYPIFGPYDESGELVSSMEYGGDLDECNGKMDESGEYGYYITPNPPFAPPCLRGKVGAFSHASTAKTCPADGVMNMIIGESEIEESGCKSIMFSEIISCIDDAPTMMGAADGSAAAHEYGFGLATAAAAGVVVAASTLVF